MFKKATQKFHIFKGLKYNYRNVQFSADEIPIPSVTVF